MIIAQEKKKSNIAEYILYMWQIEDIIRGYNFDLQKIQEEIIDNFDTTLEIKAEMRDWYKDLIQQMKDQKIEKSGHLKFLNDHVNQLNDLHQMLITAYQDHKYQKIYSEAKENMDVLLGKNPGGFNSEIEVCLVGLYGLMTLKLKKTEIGEDTAKAVKTFGNLIGYLAARYKEKDLGKLNLPDQLNN